MAYTTRTKVLTAIGHDGNTSDALASRVDAAILAAQTTIEHDTGRTFEAATLTKQFGAVGHLLKVPDLISITTLKFDDTSDGTFETTIASTEYELDTTRLAAGFPWDTVRLLNRRYPTGKRRRTIEIVGSWGFATLPDPIVQACELLAARFAQRPSSALFGVQSFGELNSQQIRSSDPDYMRLIGPYSLPRIAG
jgi:hypothetical protein